MTVLADYFSQLLPIKKITQSLKNDHQSAQLVTGLERSARSLLLAGIQADVAQPHLIVTEDLTTAQDYLDDLKELLPEETVHLFPVEDVFHAQMAVASPEMIEQRLDALAFIQSEQPGVIITTIAGLMKPLIPHEVMSTGWITIDRDDEIDVKQLTEQLLATGYKREQIVARPGEFSIRGGIIDIYPLVSENPLRIELFGDEIDTMRAFDVRSQRSLVEIEQFTVPPATDLILLPTAKERAQNQLKKQIKATSSQEVKKSLSYYLELLEEDIVERKLQGIPSLFYETPESLLDYLPEETVVYFDEYAHLNEKAAELLEEAEAWKETVKQELPIVQKEKLLFAFKPLYEKTMHRVVLVALKHGLVNLKFTALHDFHYREMQRFFGQLLLIKEEILSFKKMGFTILLLAHSKERISAIQEMLARLDIEGAKVEPREITAGGLYILPTPLQKGFEWIEEKLAVLTEADLFNKPKKRPRRQLQMDHAERIKAHNELSPGDYVVHVNHGIGKYLGIETMEVRGIKHDYLTILYQNDDKLYVPVDQLHLVQKYVSSEGVTPKIHKLGGTRWAKTKASVSKQVEDIADDLIDLYAERKARKGHAFAPTDSYYQEFADSFPYVETPDQLRSIQEVNADLDKSQPMDRLLVGDVGYGKTEVAMRAAFRTVQEGKQVAFLVPTTVLAQQHYTSFIERFVNFPIRMGLLSRFLTPKETKETIKNLKAGKIDIVIGTHRLLSKDVKFHDLGLVVVDEEQRFGVKHKEKLKELKAQVDVLTLTATPIPRTLHMSIVGARDLSVIETPPANRYPVQTYVTEMNPLIIKDAIEKEISRDGQVFYLHNRVDSIEQRVAFLEQLVPNARIGYAHGQMAEHELENILYDFVNGEYDVLVTTTIIETGIDIPNANTLIIEDANYFGLSQLYQLRGRVGRSSRMAYAYLLYRPDRILTEESEQRLKAIQDFTELGSGFKIAMRDLSIRGAGNLLGKQQHGFIDSVGFDLYSQMLAEAVAKKQGKQKQARTQLEIDLAIEAYIPSDYIRDSRQKVEMYQAVRSIAGDDAYFELQDELIDRFGDYPAEVGNLLLVGLLKDFGEKALAEVIKQESNNVRIEFSKTGSQIPVAEIFKALKEIPLKSQVDAKEKLTVTLEIPQDEKTAVWLDYLVDFMRQLAVYYDTKEKSE